jgi:hypothetical protein
MSLARVRDARVVVLDVGSLLSANWQFLLFLVSDFFILTVRHVSERMDLQNALINNRALSTNGRFVRFNDYTLWMCIKLSKNDDT